MPATFLLQGSGLSFPRFPNLTQLLFCPEQWEFHPHRVTIHPHSPKSTFFPAAKGKHKHGSQTPGRSCTRNGAETAPALCWWQEKLGQAIPSRFIWLWPQSPARGRPRLENCRMLLENFLLQTPTLPALPAGSGRLQKLWVGWAEAPRAPGINPTAFQAAEGASVAPLNPRSLKTPIPRTRGQWLTGEVQLTGIQPGKVLTPLLPPGHCLEQTWDTASTS